MVLDLSVQDIKDAAGIGDELLDEVIERLITRWQPILEADIAPASLADAAIQPILIFALTDILAGEVVGVAARRSHATAPESWARTEDGARVLDVSGDPFRLAERGWRRLTPYLQPDARKTHGVLVGDSTLPSEKAW